MRTALVHAVDHDPEFASHLVFGLSRYWQARGNGGDYTSAIELIAAVRQVFAESDRLRWAGGCFTEGYFRLTRGQYGVAAQLFDQVLAWANQHGMDPQLQVVKLYDMLPADAGDTSDGRTAADNATARSVFVIGPDKRIKATMTYPMTTGRNFEELLRLLDSCQLTAHEQVATPANWNQGEDVIIVPAVSNDEAAERYPDGWQTPLPYLRIVKQPV